MADYRRAQKAVFNGGSIFVQAGLDLRGTSLEKDYDRAWKAIEKLNDKLIKLIMK